MYIYCFCGMMTIPYSSKAGFRASSITPINMSILKNKNIRLTTWLSADPRLRLACLTLPIAIGSLLMLQGCHPSVGTHVENPKFETLDHDRTGLNFSNTLHPTRAFNVFDYMYFYNGGGVGAGDFNNDGKIDLFFAANQESNKLYLNAGDLHFTDVTLAAKIPQDSGWSTGVSVVDINNDGLLDLYICRVGDLLGLPHTH